MTKSFKFNETIHRKVIKQKLRENYRFVRPELLYFRRDLRLIELLRSCLYFFFNTFNKSDIRHHSAKNSNNKTNFETEIEFVCEIFQTTGLILFPLCQNYEWLEPGDSTYCTFVVLLGIMEL